MIYTITTNPSLDYYLSINDLKTGQLNRSINEEYDAAGKGVNVSKFLDIINIPSVALGFLGGYNKEFYLDLLSKHLNIQPQFTATKENTRINVKIISDDETSLNGKGPNITDEEYQKFSNRLKNVYENDYVVLSGNIQDELKDRVVEDIKKLIDENVNVVLDTDKDITFLISKYKPFLIKTDANDLGEDEEKIIETGRNYISKGVKYFMYSSFEMCSYLVEESGYYKCEATKDNNIFFTGISDAMIAGFLSSCLKGGNGLEAFKYANAVASSTNVFLNHADLSVINNTYDSLKVTRVDF